MKKRPALVFIAALLLLCSCTETAGNIDTAADTENISVTETEAIEEEKILTVAAAGVCNFTVVRSEDADKAVTSMSAAFKTELVKRLAADSVAITTDFVYEKAPLDPEAPELLVDETNREESAVATAELEKAGGNRYVIYASDYKLAVKGSSTYMTYLGLCHLMDNFIKTGADGKPEFTIKSGTLIVSDAYASYCPDFEEAEKSGMKLAFYNVGRYKQIKTKGTYGTMQGGGSDGTYAYYAMIDSDALKAIIYKYEIATWKLVATSEEVPTAHSNDISYDSVNKRLVLSYCHANDGYLGVCFLDAETLAFQSYTKTSFAQRAVEYLPATNQYLFGTNYFYTLTDADLNVISSFNDVCPYYTTQGMCCDSKYLYDVRWESGESVQHIIVYSFSDQKSYGEIPFLYSDGEPENMFRYGDEYVIGCNKTDSVYRVQLLPEEWW